VLPKEEACGNKLDDDCDGLVDEHCQVECPVGVSKPCVVTLNNPVDWRTDFGFCYILDEPGGMVRDGDFLYLSDTKRHRIMRYDTKTKEMAVLAGTGTIGRTNGPATKASFRSPRGLAVMGRVLYVADTANHLIRAIDLTTYEVSTVAGTGSNGAANGPPLQAQFALPRELAVDPVNRIVYVSDTGNQTIRKIELSGAGSVSVLVGLSGQNGSTDGDASQALFDGPRGLVFDATNSVLYVADRNNDRIRKVDLATRSVGTLVGTTNGHTDGAFQSVRFRAPNGLWLRGSDLYVADTGNHVIRRVDMKNQQVSTIAGTPGKQGYRNGASATDARFDTPLLISRGRNANELFVLDSINGAVRTVDLSGTRQVARLVGPGMPPYVLVPLRCVRISRPTINNLLPGSGSLLVDGDKLYFTENGVDRVFVHAIDLLTRKVKTLAGSGVQGTTNGQGSAASFDRPTGLARVGTTLYLTEPVKHTIRTIDATGTASLLAGTSGTFGSTGTNFSNVLFRVPVSIVSDGLERLYVSDMLNKAIRVLNIKQKSVSAPLLRGAPSISKPQAIVMDTTKNILYLIDNDYLIRKVEISKVTGDNLTTIYTLPASPGMGGQGTLQRIALDTTGSSLYMTVVNGNKGIRILKLDLTANPATTSRLSRTNFSIDVVDGAASQTSWARPVGIAVDSSDNIYVYDELQQRIRVILTK
jgi:sugar lactone lactonase YvrE